MSTTDDKGGLRYLYENHESFSVLPTFGVIPALSGLEALVTGQVPGLEIELANVLHGEQYVELIRPLPASATLNSRFTVNEVLDKGSGLVVLLDIESSDAASGDLVLKNQTVVFVRGMGGFNGPRKSLKEIGVASVPNRKPDRLLSFKTSVDQTAIYRLSGDLNPMHIDPNFAAIGGFSRPIMHGLCTFGIAVRLIIGEYCGGDPSLVSKIKARFSKPVYPGETLKVAVWEEGSKLVFTVEVEETGLQCITGAWLQLQPQSKI